MGVDILPTELPFESSEHFGNALLKHVLPDLINASTSTTTSTTTDGIRAINGSSSNKQQVVAGRKTTTTFVDASKLSQSLKNALITTNAGTFTEKYKYLGKLSLQRCIISLRSVIVVSLSRQDKTS